MTVPGTLGALRYHAPVDREARYRLSEEGSLEAFVTERYFLPTPGFFHSSGPSHRKKAMPLEEPVRGGRATVRRILQRMNSFILTPL